MLALLQYIGAVGVLAAFGLSQSGRWPTAGYPYQALNTVSGAALAVAGIVSGQWGFVALNGAWTVIGAYGLVTHRRKRRSPRAPGDGT